MYSLNVEDPRIGLSGNSTPLMLTFVIRAYASAAGLEKPSCLKLSSISTRGVVSISTF